MLLDMHVHVDLRSGSLHSSRGVNIASPEPLGTCFPSCQILCDTVLYDKQWTLGTYTKQIFMATKKNPNVYYMHGIRDV